MNDYWIDIDSYKVNTPETKSISGTKVSVSVAPFNIPKALRAKKTNKQLNIEFRYSDLLYERIQEQTLENGLKLEFGKKSGRLLQILIPEEFAHEHKSLTIQLEVQEVSSILKKLKKPSTKNPSNLSMATSVLDKYSETIADNLMQKCAV